MNKTVVACVAVTALAGLVGYYLYLQNNRYAVTSDGVTGYLVDKQSGQTWFLFGGEKKPVVATPPVTTHKVENWSSLPPPDSELPSTEVTKLTGDTWFSSDHLEGALYNGSAWRLNEVTIRVRAVEKDGSERWVRDYREFLKVEPLTSQELRIRVSNGWGATPQLNILSARGVKVN